MKHIGIQEIATCNKMRVLHAIPSIAAHHGGPSQSVAGLLNALPIETGLICSTDTQEPDLSRGITRTDMKFILPRFAVPQVAQIRRMRAAIARADLVHVHSYWNGFAAIMIHLARHSGRPVVLSPRGCLHQDAVAQSSSRVKALFAALGVRRQLASVSGVHFQTDEEATASLGVQDLPQTIIDNGVCLPDLATSIPQLRARLFGPSSDKLNFVFLGRIARIKGIDLQLQALRLLHDRGVMAVLHLVGPDGGDLHRLQSIATTLGLRSYIRVHGPVYSGEKHNWLRAADAVLMSSEFENNSNAALEAMAAGGILVGTEGTIPDGPTKAHAAVQVPRCALTIANILAKPTDPTIRDAARAYVGRHHDWRPRASRMVDFYESLL